jgi:hypothetical protein
VRLLLHWLQQPSRLPGLLLHPLLPAALRLVLLWQLLVLVRLLQRLSQQQLQLT